MVLGTQEAGCWREVVKLGDELLAIADRESNTTSSLPSLLPDVVLRIHSYVAAALTRLRRFDVSTQTVIIGSLYKQ
jgi:hypothetical protein